MKDIIYNTPYDYEDVKDEVRAKQIQILDAVAEICDRHDLGYWLDCGTLLGAVRHQGFIPWDDDIDIGMMREDYDRFVSIVQDELPNEMFFQSRKTDPLYKLPFSKIRDVYSDVGDNYNYNGIFIDIFPHDRMPEAKWAQKIQHVLFKVFEASFVYTDLEELNIGKKKDIVSKAIAKVMSLFAFVGKYLSEDSIQKIHKLILVLSNFGSKQLYGHGAVFSAEYDISIHEKDVFFPLKEIEFCGKKYKCLNNNHTYLHSLYGPTYMTPLKTDIIHMEKIVFLSDKGKDD